MVQVMTDAIKRFIERNKDYIEREDWAKVYEEANGYLSTLSVGTLTYHMMEAGINPLEGLTYIPQNYLFGLNLTSFIIPDSITKIEFQAFGFCERLDEMFLPTNLEEIGDKAFAGCGDLKRLIIPKTVQLIGHYALAGCTNLQELIYSGKMRDWEKIDTRSYWHTNCPVTHVTCKDGTITL